jgi:hypothetical protein
MYCRVRDIEWSCIAVLVIPSGHVLRVRDTEWSCIAVLEISSGHVLPC